MAGLAESFSTPHRNEKSARMTLILKKRYFFINLDGGTRADGYDSHGVGVSREVGR
jgi:hypothetical protein